MAKRTWLVLLAAACGLTALAWFWATAVSHLATFFGYGNGQGNSSHYLFWSGAGSDLAYLSFLVAGITVYRKHNCATRYCWRIGKHEFANPETGITRLLCARHHPDVHRKTLTRADIEDIQKKRHLYMGKNPGRG